jgi:hypothetical protein
VYHRPDLAPAASEKCTRRHEPWPLALSHGSASQGRSHTAVRIEDDCTALEVDQTVAATARYSQEGAADGSCVTRTDRPIRDSAARLECGPMLR